MIQSLQQVLEERLRSEGAGGIKPDRFAELAGRLLASGIVWRDFSRPEAELYDDAASANSCCASFLPSPASCWPTMLTR